jgi:DNA-binding CsgD family transcriptional regulator
MTIRIYPGMLDQSKEYFNYDNDVFFISNGEIKLFDEEESHPELEQILDDEEDLNELMKKWFGNEKKIKLKTLAGCRFGALNFTPDFNEGVSSNDYCECKYRGSCPGENIICKPVSFKGVEISNQEIELLKMLSTNEKNSTIAERLDLPVGTFNVLKTNTYQKFGFITKQQLTKELYLEGML